VPFLSNRRVRAVKRPRFITALNEHTMTATVTVGGFNHYEVPIRFEVCPTCNGRGRLVNPSIDAGGVSPEELDDPDFREDYLAGMYDMTCPECGGRRVVAKITNEKIIAAIATEKAEEAAFQRMCDMERCFVP